MAAKIAFVALIFLTEPYGFSQPVYVDSRKDSTTDSVIVLFDSTVTRIPGSFLPIGISHISSNGEILQTKGFLKGTMK